MVVFIFHYGLSEFTNTLCCIRNFLVYKTKILNVSVYRHNHTFTCKVYWNLFSNDEMKEFQRNLKYYLNTHSLIYNAPPIISTHQVRVILKSIKVFDLYKKHEVLFSELFKYFKRFIYSLSDNVHVTLKLKTTSIKFSF